MPRNGIFASYITSILNTTHYIMGHFYTFESAAGVFDYFTDLDIDIVFNGNHYKSAGIRIEGLRRKISVGLEVDEQEVKIIALPTDTLFGGVFLASAENGALDGCLITRTRAIWAVRSGNLIADVTEFDPIQTWTMFTGYVSEITGGGRTMISLKVKSPLVKLEVNMPRNFYQPGCLWTLYDNGCTLNKNSFSLNGTVQAMTNSTYITVLGGISPANGPDSIPMYAQGRILFTSGANAGLQTLVNSNDGQFIVLAYPLHILCSPGDTFTVYQGCSKSFNTCNVKFNNDQNFRGFDKVPPVSVSI